MSRLNKLNTGVLATTKVKAPDTVNRQGHAAYALGYYHGVCQRINDDN